MPDPLLKSELPASFSFSQSSLQDYANCPRLFQLRYIERMAWPAIDVEPVLENERRKLAGGQFHRMVQQHLIGLPVEKLEPLPDTPELRRWWDNYLAASAEITGGNSRRVEQVLTAPVGGYHLLAKYDLLVFESAGKVTIYDWKTSRKRLREEWLAARFQTRVYRALLVQAGAWLNGGQPIDPDRVEMVYWFAEQPHEPVCLPYSTDQYQRDWEALSAMIQEICNHRYFPASEPGQDCGYCRYRSYCNRGEKAGVSEDLEADQDDATDFYLDLDGIAEIEL